MIYKYYAPTPYNFDAIEKGYFFFSKAKTLNDPFDASFRLVTEAIRDRLYPSRQSQRKAFETMQEYGICSFSENWDNNILWAYYAQSYKGFVVAFDENKFISLTDSLMARIPYQKVSYVETIDDVLKSRVFPYYEPESGNKEEFVIYDILDDIKKQDKFFVYICSLKSIKWQSENEWRLIAANDVIQNKIRLEKKQVSFEEKGYKIPFPDDVVKGIYVGYNFEKSKGLHLQLMKSRHKLKSIQMVSPSEKPFALVKRQYIF